MARFRNRMVKAEFWTDGELLRWPMAKRVMYQGLWAIAEDSGCLEDDPFEWRMQLFPSPRDNAITEEDFETWRAELVAAGKLIPFRADGKACVYLRKFHEHEHPRNPQSPGLPLPPWVEWRREEHERSDGRTNKVNAYVVLSERMPPRPGEPEDSIPTPPRADAESVPTPGGTGRGSPVLSCPVQSSPDLTAGAHAGDSQIKSGVEMEDGRLASLGEDQESTPGATLDALRHNPTCDGEDCSVRRLRIHVRGEVSEIVGSDKAGQLYSEASDINHALAGMAGYVCAACWRASAGPGVDPDDRRPLCEKAMREFVAALVAFHRQTPIRSLPAFLRTRYGNMTEAPVSDEIFLALRQLEHVDRRDGDAPSEPQRVAGLRDLIPEPAAVESAS